MSKELIYEVSDRVATLTINRPERRNAMNSQVLEGLLAGLLEARDDPEVRVLVVTGAGEKAFCSGADLEQTMPDGASGGAAAAHASRGVLAEVFGAFFTLGKPAISRVNGHALAGGMGLALAADIVIAAETATFGTPEIDVGLWPMMITTVLRRSMPPKVALELMMTGRRLTAFEAAEVGFVNRVVPFVDLDTAVAELAGNLASKSPTAMRLGRNAFYSSWDMPVSDALEYLQAMLSVLTATEDAEEGMKAFLEKRRPVWKGR